MEKLIKTNRGFIATIVLERIFGKNLTTKNTVRKYGLNYG